MRFASLRPLCLLLVLILVTSEVAADGLQKLVITDHRVGNGATAVLGSEVELNYTGWLYDESAPDHHGKQIDSSYARGKTISFTVGDHKVIAGWDKGVRGMRAGGQRTLLVPPNMGYGGRAIGDLVPAHSSLVFDIELVSVR